MILYANILNTFLGTLILFKDITQHEEDLKTIKDNQDMLIVFLTVNDLWLLKEYITSLILIICICNVNLLSLYKDT